MKSSFSGFFATLRKGSIPAILKNKYLIVSIAFLTWMLFFDNNDLVSQVQLRMKLSEYQGQKDYYEQKIREVKQEKQELLTNQQSLEKFAREQYMMKKDDEDLFVIVPEKEKWIYTCNPVYLNLYYVETCTAYSMGWKQDAYNPANLLIAPIKFSNPPF